MASRESDYRTFNILYVDEDVASRTEFTEAFATDFSVLTADTIESARQILENSEVAAVISGGRRIVDTNLQLLAEIGEKYPAVVRVLTASDPEPSSLISAINSSAVHYFVDKPWKKDGLGHLFKEWIDTYAENILYYRSSTEKLRAVRTWVLADRLKAMASVADGLGRRIETLINALNRRLENSTVDPTKFSDQIDSEIHHLHQLIQRYTSAASPPHFSFTDEIDIEQLLKDAASTVANAGQGVTSIDIAMDISTELPMFKIDRAQVTRMLSTLIEQTSMHCSPGGSILVSATDKVVTQGGSGLRIVVAGEGPAWSKAKSERMLNMFNIFEETAPHENSLSLLSAFFIAYHHGGELEVHSSAPGGPGFEVRIPFAGSPFQYESHETNFMEKLLLKFDFVSPNGLK